MVHASRWCMPVDGAKDGAVDGATSAISTEMVVFTSTQEIRKHSKQAVSITPDKMDLSVVTSQKVFASLRDSSLVRIGSLSGSSSQKVAPGGLRYFELDWLIAYRINKSCKTSYTCTCNKLTFSRFSFEIGFSSSQAAATDVPTCTCVYKWHSTERVTLHLQLQLAVVIVSATAVLVSWATYCLSLKDCTSHAHDLPNNTPTNWAHTLRGHLHAGPRNTVIYE